MTVGLRDDARCVLAKERIDGLREDVKEINQRLDKFASGMIDKMKGDTQLAAQVQQNRELVQFLDDVLVRGSSGNSSIKAEVENLRKEVNHLAACCKKAESELADVRREKTALEAAKITASSTNWKTTAVLIGTALTAIASLVVAIWK